MGAVLVRECCAICRFRGHYQWDLVEFFECTHPDVSFSTRRIMHIYSLPRWCPGFELDEKLEPLEE